MLTHTLTKNAWCAPLLADILGDQMTGITLFLPDNAAVNATLAKKGLDLPGLLKVQSLCEQIIAYHILPSPLEVRAPGLASLSSALAHMDVLFACPHECELGHAEAGLACMHHSK